MRWIPLYVILLCFISCKKEKHAIPTIQIEWVGENGPFGFGQSLSVSVEAQAGGHDPIEKITMQLCDAQQKVWLSVTSVDRLPSAFFNGNLSVELNDPYLPSGQYYIKVTAHTEHTSKSAFLDCTILELTKKRKNIFVINNNGFAGAMIDTLSYGMQMGTWRSALGPRNLPTVNSYNKTFWSSTPGQSTLEMMDIQNLYSELFSYPFAGSHEYFVDASNDPIDQSIW